VRAVLRRLLLEGRDPANTAALAAWTQATMSRWVAHTAMELAACHGIGQVVASGGCLFNPWLRSALRQAARQHSLTLLLNRLVPPGDGGLTLGQVYVAAARAEVTLR
jgi:hydrogenase maturation protein HypF